MSAPYLELEARARYALTERFSLVGGVNVTLLGGQDELSWGVTPSASFHAGQCPSPDADVCQSLARLKAERITGATVVTVTPFIGVRASF